MILLLFLALIFVLSLPVIVSYVMTSNRLRQIEQLRLEVAQLRATVLSLIQGRTNQVPPDIAPAPTVAPNEEPAGSEVWLQPDAEPQSGLTDSGRTAPLVDELLHQDRAPGTPLASEPGDKGKTSAPETGATFASVFGKAEFASAHEPHINIEDAASDHKTETVLASLSGGDESASAHGPGAQGEGASSSPTAPAIGSGSEPPQRTDGPGTDWLSSAIRRWLFTGNLVAKFGLMILFIGVAFLLKYAAEKIVIPIEVRLAAVVVVDLAFLVWAWRIRDKRRDVALPAQGAAIAILMLVVFAAYQRFALIPSWLTFALLVVLTAFTCLLAILQEAVWLASFGIAGGFAVPVLVSTGTGSHIALFSYYALLNSGVFFISFKRAWRLLNLLGFAFTFIVGAAWGWTKYDPAQHYLSTQLFLILFFLFYVAIAIAFAYRRAPQLKEYFDATLILGTPLLAFGLQYGIIKDRHFEFGMALSALALGVFYLGLAHLLWRRGRDTWRPLVETFLALGVVFGTLALPLAFDERWTSAAWALEGAGFVWIGLRQQQPRTWIFGLLVQAGAWFSFIAAITGMDTPTALHSNVWLGFLLLAGSTFGIAFTFQRQSANGASSGYSKAANGFLAIAGVWLLWGLWYEISLRTTGVSLQNLLVGGAFLTAVILNVIGSRLQWESARKLALIAQLAGACALIFAAVSNWRWMETLRDPASDKPLLGALMISVAALFTSWTMQKRLGEEQDKKISSALLLWGGFWWFGPVLYMISGDAVRLLPGDAPEYWKLGYDLLATASAIGLVWLAHRLAWSQPGGFGVLCWVLLAWRTVDLLGILYIEHRMPAPPAWIAYAVLWMGSELLLKLWPAYGRTLKPLHLQVLHFIRTAGPWLAIWPAGGILVSSWLSGGSGDQPLALPTSGSWSTYLPAWVMLFAVLWLISRSRTEAWPTKPVSAWYRTFLIPCATAWALLLAAAWNLAQDGAMEPLPYLPLLNPLDLTTGFAAVLAVVTWRMLLAEPQRHAETTEVLNKLPTAGALAAFAWFNLMLLRTAGQYLHIPYQLDQLAASQFVQAMLSLVWAGTALILMRRAWRRKLRRQWGVGAALLAIVVAKLFLVDFSNAGVERIVSLVGVGVLMVIIGYVAPYPKAGEEGQEKQVVTAK